MEREVGAEPGGAVSREISGSGGDTGAEEPYTIGKMAYYRRQLWLRDHGAHEWEKHDLVTEAKEELADAHNYLRAEIGLREFDSERLVSALVYLELAWNALQADPPK